MNSRDEFVKQVAKAITDAQNDSKRKESFIFGLSAKWGEGKTTFLDGLKKKLNDSIVVEVNPWKYSDNKVTFLQSFLLVLLDLSDIKSKDNVRDEILMTKTENRIEMKKGKWWLILIATAIIISVVLNLLPQLIPSFPSWVISVVQFSGTIAIIPWMMNHFEQVASSTVTDKTTSALIGFDATLTQILSSYSKHIVIYVDDLDRISAKNAVLVLDNLRTFFDRKELCFVVSGDHSVMERHIGNELLPDGQAEDRMEEGRRYLKKVFNIYWRMPVPTNDEISEYISEEINTKLQGFGLTDIEVKQLAALLNKLFENNYRNIERMVSQIAFTLQIVQGKLDSCGNDETRSYYEDLSQNKMLLVKVLLIQELANPYYEHLLLASDDLRLSDKKQKIFSEDASALRLTTSQQKNLDALIEAEPRFHGKNGLVVYDMKPFIFLSADSNFGDNRGLLPKEFHARLSESLSDSSEFEKLLQQHSVEMLRKGVDAMVAERKTAEEIPPAASRAQALPTTEMAQEVIALIKRLNELDDAYAAQKQEFKVCFDPEFITRFVALNSTEYAEMVFALGELCRDDTDYADSLVSRADAIIAQQFLVLIQYADDKEINPLFESVLWKCFENLGTQKLNAFITKFGSIVDALGDCSLPDDTLSVLVSRIQSNYTDETAKTAAKVILKSGDTEYVSNAIDATKALLQLQHPALIEVLRILDAENCESHLLTYIDEAVNYQDLYKRMQFVITCGVEEDKVWQDAIDNKLEMLISVLALPTPNPHLVSPSSAQAKRLTQKVIRYAKDNDENHLLTSINKDAFLFANLDSVRGDTSLTKHLEKLKKYGEQSISDSAKLLLSLGEKED